VSRRALAYEIIALGAMVLLTIATVRAIRRWRRHRRKEDRLLALVAAVGLLAMLVAFGPRTVGLLGDDRDGVGLAALGGGWIVVTVTGLAVADSVVRRTRQLIGRVLANDRFRSVAIPALLAVAVLGTAAVLLRIDPPPVARTTTITPAPDPPGRPLSLILVPDLTREGDPVPDVPDLSLSAITEPGALMLPTFLTSPPGDDRLFVLERMGRIRVIEGGELRAQPVLDITDLVGPGSDGGLIGLAFHPDFATTGRMFISYTDTDDDNRIVEYVLDPETAELAPTPAIELIHVEKPDEGLHAGGMLQFGPDGLLYIAIGDPNPSSAQDPDSGRGILRLDVDSGSPYTVPASNAFDDRPAGETFAYGLRNPYRFWIDAATSRMFIGDVGEGTWEEIDTVAIDEPGTNFGWNIVEGTLCFGLEQGFVESCDRSGLTGPLFTYRNLRANPADVTGGGCAVIMGGTYRGSEVPELDGWTLYTDYCNRWIGGFRFADGLVADRVLWWPTDDETLGTPISFGLDSEGEMYLLTSAEGLVYRIAGG
jgi:glucose/arabinose dehydrogenase